jgi:GT2 family glycosyltransferase/glycosyltransferase involved in cell wall biosynthesis
MGAQGNDGAAKEEDTERLRAERSEFRLQVEELRRERNRLARELRDERNQVAEEARRIADSSSWRYGHRLARLLRALTLRGTRRSEGAPEALAERFERRLELPEVAEASSAPVRSRQVAVGAEQLEQIAGRPLVTVVVPVHNAAAEFERCLEALLRNTPGADILLIDDASTDPGVEAVLERYGPLPGVKAIRNATNLGFTATVNRGFEAAGRRDVVVLNSDTEVPPRWIENLAFAAYSDSKIATVTPFSNNAGAFSAPENKIENPLPEDLGSDELGRLITQTSERLYPDTPTANGYCMYVKRAALDQVGLFDAESFPRGYGEENDFCLRASREGWRHVVDDATYVIHEREASFGEEKTELLEHGTRLVHERYPEYASSVREFLTSPEMERARRNVGVAHDEAAGADLRPRVLFVLHAGFGGTPLTNLDLMEALSDRWSCLVLTSDTRTLTLSVLEDGVTTELSSWQLDGDPWRITDLSREDYREIVASILVSYNVELVHVRSLFKHPLDLPPVAEALGIPVILSFHDFYLSCPTIHLIDDNDRYCGGICTPGDGNCRISTQWLKEMPHLKHRWVYEWRAAVEEMLGSVAACVTTSEHAREVYQRSVPRLRGMRFELIEHGRDLAQSRGLNSPPSSEGPIRILLPGNINVHKGAAFARALEESDADGRLEFHILGKIHADYEDLGIVHGEYERDRFADWVAKIAPSFIAIFSIWGETYCHTLTEAWAAGVPVLATDIGVLRERIRRHGGGWLLDLHDPGGAYERILEISDDADTYASISAEANIAGLPSTAEMGLHYEALYGEVLSRSISPEPTLAPA